MPYRVKEKLFFREEGKFAIFFGVNSERALITVTKSYDNTYKLCVYIFLCVFLATSGLNRRRLIFYSKQ